MWVYLNNNIYIQQQIPIKAKLCSQSADRLKVKQQRFLVSSSNSDLFPIYCFGGCADHISGNLLKEKCKKNLLWFLFF